MGSFFSGSKESSIEIPKWLEKASQDAVQRGMAAGDIGYVPYLGPEVAAFSPQQEAAFANTNAMAQDFGMQGGVGTGMPQVQDFNGVRGYASAPAFEGIIAQMDEQMPGLMNYIRDFFIDPVTGEPRARANAKVAQVMNPEPPQRRNPAEYNGGYGDLTAPMSGLEGMGQNFGTSGGGFGGYTSFGDMFDGGGPGVSGGAFQGGGALSAAANVATGGDGWGGKGFGGFGGGNDSGGWGGFGSVW